MVPRTLKVAILALAVLTLTAALPALATAEERILGFTSDIEIHPDATLTVTENIRVRAEGEKIKRGIYRDFPTKYRDRLGNGYRVKFELLEIRQDGELASYHTETTSDGIRIYIGEEDVFLDQGEYTYTLTYVTNRQIGYFEGFDELYWNVTGNAWEFPIDRAECSIKLPPGAEAIQTAAYTGSGDMAEQGYVRNFLPDGRLRFTTTMVLKPGEGFTVAVGWPKGLVFEPSTEDKIGYYVEDNMAGSLAMGWTALILVYYLAAWVMVGRDPSRGDDLSPQFTPPLGLSPAATRFIMRTGFDHKAFAASIVNLAVKGAVDIEDDDGVFVLKRKSKSLEGLSGGEKKVVTTLFSGGQTLRLKNTNHAIISKAIKGLQTHLKLEYEKAYFVTNSKFLIPGIAMTVLALLTIAVFAPEPALAGFMALWLSIWTIGVTALLVSVYKAWKTAITGGGKAAAMGITLFSIPFVGGEILGLAFFTYAASALAVLALILILVFNVLFYQLLKAPTIQGRRVMDALESFKDYLSSVEEHRYAGGEQTPQVFERYLPYAMALDVETSWTERFSSVLAGTQSQSGRGYAPNWYHGDTWDRMGASGFASALGGRFSSAVSSSSSAPGSSSSGSSGGGSSGGGGGGGGGGGW